MSSHKGPSVSVNSNHKALADKLTEVAFRTEAIDEAKAAEIRQLDPVSVLMKLNDESFYVKNRELKAAMSAHEQEILGVLSTDKRETHRVTGMLLRMEDLVQAYDAALARAREHRHELDPERLEQVIATYSADARCEGINDRNIPWVASCIFAQFARRVLEFVPSLAPEYDPSRGPKLWMYAYDRQREELYALPVRYVWPDEANVVVQHRDFACSEEMLRTALMCLQNSCGRCGSERELPFPLATVDNCPDGKSWPVWPLKYGPYTLRLPTRLDNFLNAVTIGAGLSLDNLTPNPRASGVGSPNLELI